jgi:hypothetical protein
VIATRCGGRKERGPVRYLFRYVVRKFDADDMRWLIIVALAVGMFHSLDAGWQAQRDNRLMLSRIWDLELEAQELRTQLVGVNAALAAKELEEDARPPTAHEWGGGGMGEAQRWDGRLVTAVTFTNCSAPACQP